MLIIALVLAVIGLAALVTAVVTSNELIAWVCIAASVLGVILLIIDAIRDRQRRHLIPAEVGADAAGTSAEDTYQTFDADYPDEESAVAAAPVAEDDAVADDDVVRSDAPAAEAAVEESAVDEPETVVHVVEEAEEAAAETVDETEEGTASSER